MYFSSATEVASTAAVRPWQFRGRQLLPVVQGGMGVGVSAGRLAGTVASFDAVGTISSVDLRRLHPDLMERTGHLEGPGAKAQIDAANQDRRRRHLHARRRAQRAILPGAGRLPFGTEIRPVRDLLQSLVGSAAPLLIHAEVTQA